jgi:hypothetical protein
MPIALRGEEGRDKLRKATGMSTYQLIRRYPNGATRLAEGQSHRKMSEPAELKHLSKRRKRKQASDSAGSGERKRNSPNRVCYGKSGVVGLTETIKKESKSAGKLSHRA